MKKLVFIGSTVITFLTPITVFAAGHAIIIVPPSQGFKTLGDFVSNALTISFVFAVLIVLVMLIWGAYEWIASGGDKEAVGKARSRIINALIGLAVLSIAFALARIAGQFLGVDITQLAIPTPKP